MDMRDMRGRDGRNPYGSRGGYVVSSRGRGRGGRGRGRRGDRGMDYGYDMAYDMRGQGRGESRGRSDRGNYGDYNEYDMRRGDYRGGDMGDYGDMRMRDGHHYPEHQMGMGGQTYYPIEAMGRFNGYWGMPQEDYGANYRYGGGMGGRMDYGYDYGYGDYGEALSEQELESWNKRLMEQLDDREKQMFRKEAIIPKFKQMGIEMKGFNEEELYTITLAQYTDHKQSIGQNSDLAIRLARDFMVDQDSNTKGSERVAIYYDTFVED